MKVQALIPTMHQTDFSILDKMNIQTDAIVVNQCDRFSKDEFERNGRKILFYSLDERGVGLSRNFSLMRATGDIVLFSDDDIEYYDGYEEQLIKAFEDVPDADMIVFNLDYKDDERASDRKKLSKIKRVRWYNCSGYGAARVAVKTESIKKANVAFSLLFGGGAKYSAGEDVLFINEAVRAGLHMYTYPVTLAQIEGSTSTWFKGYDEKLFKDKGVLYAALNKRAAILRAIIYVVRYPHTCNEHLTVKKAFKLICEGIREFKRR
ncbi:MAG: glycosyltransferase family 2 protein [Clostridia bacterium]|nr:glycosyltransferase family 2 protein [Clostridia bacterium]